MYKTFYDDQIKKISKILEEENIHIIETWANYEKYIYNVSDERNICTDLVLTLDQNPKYMKVLTLEKIEDYIKFNPFRPEFFSLQYKDDNLLTEQIDFDIYEYDPKGAIVSMRIEYKKTEDYEDFDIEINKDNTPYLKSMMIYVNNAIKNLENEFNIDLSSEKFNLTNKEETIKDSWTKIYNFPFFGEYALRFKIYKENHKYMIEIENPFTDKIYKINSHFSSYDDAVDWVRYIKDSLIPSNNKNLEERIQI